MPKFYFTYACDAGHPFEGGWTEVEAPNQDIAEELFDHYHPSRDPGGLKCEYVLDESEFLATDMLLNCHNGACCQEEITVSRNIIAEESDAEIANMTNFDKITESPETLAAFLSSLPCIEEPWDEEFQELLCAACIAPECENCQSRNLKNTINWWLNLETDLAEKAAAPDA